MATNPQTIEMLRSLSIDRSSARSNTDAAPLGGEQYPMCSPSQKCILRTQGEKLRFAR